MDVMQKIRLHDQGIWDLLFSGFKIRPDQEDKLTLNQYQNILEKDHNYVQEIIKEARYRHVIMPISQPGRIAT